MLNFLWIIFGVIGLYIGGEGLVKGAYHSALRLGVSTLSAGLLIVACSTSMPELVASLVAQVWQNNGDIALGNVVGSNIVNVGLMLGIAACITPIKVSRAMAIREMPLMVGALAIFSAFLFEGELSRISGIVMLALFVFYSIFQVKIGRKEHRGEALEHALPNTWVKDLVFLLGGVAALVLGGFSLIEGAVGIARAWGMSDRVVGLTIVAVGTSLPELSTSCVAAWRGHGDIAFGNIIGSNIFNALVIAGGVAVISPIAFSPKLLSFDVPIMLGMSVLLWLLMLGKQFGRRSGILLIALYLTYFIVLAWR
ncbi:MAG: calcium/sodium antiporter [Verrucomicrobia bacterium]|nr:calcium/sodium antiporter [Verrucomicrobiota bacterium]